MSPVGKRRSGKAHPVSKDETVLLRSQLAEARRVALTCSDAIGRVQAGKPSTVFELEDLARALAQILLWNLQPHPLVPTRPEIAWEVSRKPRRPWGTNLEGSVTGMRICATQEYPLSAWEIWAPGFEWQITTINRDLGAYAVATAIRVMRGEA
jgi:hypothetical protein